MIGKSPDPLTIQIFKMRTLQNGGTGADDSVVLNGSGLVYVIGEAAYDFDTTVSELTVLQQVMGQSFGE